jgi:hypothetical protein
MKALRWAILLAALTGLSFTYMGCSAIMGNLPAVLAYVQDGQLVLSAIESFANAVFAAGFKPEIKQPVTSAIARAKAALSAALRAGTGVEKLNQADVDAAFVEFRLAYTDLVNLMAQVPGFSVQGKTMKAAPGGGPAGTLVVPEPLLISRKL